LRINLSKKGKVKKERKVKTLKPALEVKVGGQKTRLLLWLSFAAEKRRGGSNESALGRGENV